MPEIETTRPETLLPTKVGTTSVEKKLVGYDRVMLPPAGSTEDVLNNSVAKTPPFEAIRSYEAMVRATSRTCPPALVGWSEQMISTEDDAVAAVVEGGAVDCALVAAA